MNLVIRILIKLGILKDDLDYHLVRAAMVIIFLFFGYSKWFKYEAQALIPYISNGPLIAWLYPFSASGAPVDFWEFPSGRLVRSCSQGSGIRNWESLEPSVHVFHLSRPLRSSHFSRMVGKRLPVGFPQ